MKLILATVITAIFSGAVFASNGPYPRYPRYSTAVSCATLQNAIRDAGGLVVYRAPHLYELYVSRSYYCPNDEVTDYNSVPTRDGRCSVYTCKRRDRGN